MGTFMGHFQIFAMMTILSLWWMYCHIYNYFDSKAKRQEFRSRLWYPSTRFPNIPMESLLKLITTISILIGLICYHYAVDPKTRLSHHGSILALMAISYMVEIITFYRTFPLLPDFDWCIHFLTTAAMVFVFGFHGHGQAPLEQSIHMFLPITTGGIFVGQVLQALYRNSFCAAMVAPFFVFMTGIWFGTIAFTLFPPFPGMTRLQDTTPDHHMMNFIIAFVWQCLGTLVIMLLMQIRVGKKFHFTKDYSHEKSYVNNGCI